MVDINRLQGFGYTDQVLQMEPLAEKWRAFGWGVRDLDGHDHGALHQFFEDQPLTEGKPTVALLRTVKGKGISFMEDRLEWHYKSPNDDQFQQAMGELGVAP